MFELPKLGYKYNELEPYIDEQTMTIHHTKHHQTYIDNLNKAISSFPEMQKMDLESLISNIEKAPENVRQTLINNAGGHYNHSFFWKILSPKKSEPGKEILQALKTHFGSLDSFKEKFTERAMNVFGSGWCFLVVTKNKEIILKRQSFQNPPVLKGYIPLLGIDLWEHAYYLKYQNRKKEYIDAWWNVVNWDQVNLNLKNL